MAGVVDGGALKAMGVGDQIRAAIGEATAWRRLTHDLPPSTRAAGLAFLPLVGALVGALSAAAGALGAAVPFASVALSVVVLEALGGHRATLAGGIAAMVKAGALFALPGTARLVALVLAPALGRWAMVVQCYGGAPAPGTDAHPLVGRARFREFGIASVTAIGGALVTLDALGLLTVLAAALATIGLRTLAYRSEGGLTRTGLERTETVIEAIVLCVLAGVVSAMG